MIILVFILASWLLRGLQLCQFQHVGDHGCITTSDIMNGLLRLAVIGGPRFLSQVKIWLKFNVIWLLNALVAPKHLNIGFNVMITRNDINPQREELSPGRLEVRASKKSASPEQIVCGSLPVQCKGEDAVLYLAFDSYQTMEIKN